MEQISPEYLVDVAVQAMTVTAVLGGLAATFLGTLLILPEPSRVADWCIGSAAASAVLFAVSTVASYFIILDASVDMSDVTLPATTYMAYQRVLAGTTFATGIYTLLLSVGLSGWTRSRRVGIVTSLVAGLGALAVASLLFVSF